MDPDRTPDHPYHHLPKFRGNEDPEWWIAEYENICYCDGIQYPPLQGHIYAGGLPYSLVGEARHWFFSIPVHLRSDYHTFGEIFKQAWFPQEQPPGPSHAYHTTDISKSTITTRMKDTSRLQDAEVIGSCEDGEGLAAIGVGTGTTITQFVVSPSLLCTPIPRDFSALRSEAHHPWSSIRRRKTRNHTTRCLRMPPKLRPPLQVQSQSSFVGAISEQPLDIGTTAATPPTDSLLYENDLCGAASPCPSDTPSNISEESVIFEYERKARPTTLDLWFDPRPAGPIPILDQCAIIAATGLIGPDSDPGHFETTRKVMREMITELPNPFHRYTISSLHACLFPTGINNLSTDVLPSYNVLKSYLKGWRSVSDRWYEEGSRVGSMPAGRGRLSVRGGFRGRGAYRGRGLHTSLHT